MSLMAGRLAGAMETFASVAATICGTALPCVPLHGRGIPATNSGVAGPSLQPRPACLAQAGRLAKQQAAMPGRTRAPLVLTMITYLAWNGVELIDSLLGSCTTNRLMLADRAVLLTRVRSRSLPGPMVTVVLLIVL